MTKRIHEKDRAVEALLHHRIVHGATAQVTKVAAAMAAAVRATIRATSPTTANVLVKPDVKVVAHRARGQHG